MMNERKTKTDFEKLAAMTDDEIDCSDIPEFTEEFLATVEGFAEVPEKEMISIRIDKPILDFYRQMGKGYQGRINAVLRAHVEMTQRKRVPKKA
jgi:uncharacterized protein (DUF4415 family)